MLTTREHHHYENVNSHSIAFYPSCSFYRRRPNWQQISPSISDDINQAPDSPTSSSSSSSSSASLPPFASKSLSQLDREPFEWFASDVSSVASKMTDKTATVGFAEHRQDGSPVDDVRPDDRDHLVPVCTEDETHQYWALVSQRDNTQLKIEARNSFVCFIGADPASCELVLQCKYGDTTIDGRQAVLVYANGSFHLKDLNSSYGTYINERRVPSRCFVQLNEHDQIRFGFSTEVYELLQCLVSSTIATDTPTSPACTIDDNAKCRSVTSTTAHHNHRDHDHNNQHDNSLSPLNSSQDKLTQMNKLLRLKSVRRKHSSKHSKDDSFLSSTTASSKLSPSSSSLMSSASSNSSSSSSTTFPSSVFMSAMKMMKLRFKKKTTKDKSLVCSGNEDITFIRYDSHSDVASGQLATTQSPSAPGSPSQPHSRLFSSHTCLDHCYSEDPNEILFVCDPQQFNMGVSVVEEHDYDEVTREEEAEICGDQDQRSAAINVTETLDLGAESILDSVDETGNLDEECTLSDLVGENDDDEEDVYGHVDAFDEFEDCSHKPYESVNLGSFHAHFEEEEKAQSLSSSIIVLPHLNSEDRLNNNSSLDALLSESMFAQKPLHCEVDSSQPDDSQVLTANSSNDSSIPGDSLKDYVQCGKRVESEHECDQKKHEGERTDQSSTASVIAHIGIMDSHDTGIQHKCLSVTSSASDGSGSGNKCPSANLDATVGARPPSSQCQEKESFLKPSSPQTSPNEVSPNVVSAPTTAYDLQNAVTRANGSSSEELVDAVSECEYDIDDIGHLRRQVKSSSSGSTADEMKRQSNSGRENDDKALASGEQTANLLSKENQSNEPRHAVGGMAFVIDFGQEDDGSLFVGNRRQNPANEHHNKATSNFVRQLSKRSRNVTKSATSNKAPLSSAVSRNDENKSKVMLQECHVDTLKSPTKNSESVVDKNLKVITAVEVETVEPSENSSTVVNVCNFSKQFSCKSSVPDCSTSIPVAIAAAGTNSASMKKNNECIDNCDTSSRRSSASFTRRTTRSGQLSESAVYLINRMFEDSDYHRYNHDNPETNDLYVDYTDAPYYPATSSQHARRRSVSSSRSASPYSLPCAQQDPNSTHYVCNSSSASTRMEYDESLSSLHSNSDSAHRLSHLQSLTTVVVQSRSSQSTLEKQVDSAIDDDGDLIADDLSDTGTYTVEIDVEGKRHKKKKSANNSMESSHCDDVSPNGKQVSHVSDEDTTAAEVVTNTDYESEPEEEDKLEIARRKIDELFNVYSNKSQHDKDSLHSKPRESNTGNNGTFTRSKRRTSHQTMSTDEEDEMVVTSATSDECISSDFKSKSVSNQNDKSKKRISSELMSALKKINSKLEKTVKMGNISNENSKTKLEAPKSTSTATKHKPSALPKVPNYTPKNSSKSFSAPGTPLLSDRENRKNFNLKVQSKVSGTSSVVSSRKNSVTSISSIDDRSTSVDDFEDQRSFGRNRSESVNSVLSNQSNLRFNRAFALRRARLGMDTCGVEISEQAANKAKESQAKPVPKKQPISSFRRNDGGRFSLRVPSSQLSSTSKTGSRNSPVVAKPVSSTRKESPTVKSSVSTSVKPSNAKQTRTAYSSNPVINSSTENLSASKIPCPRTTHARKRSVNTKSPTPKVSHSDNEINHDGGESSCDETQILTRFGRSSLRCSSNSSTPWLQSLKANSQNMNLAKQGLPPSRGTPLFASGAPIQKSSSFSSNAVKNYTQRSNHGFANEQPHDIMSDNAASDCVRSIPTFQMGKRFFSTKPHQMAQFDRDFSSVTRCSSANPSGSKLSSDPNLMTHSATESLLSRHNMPALSGIGNRDANNQRLEENPSSVNANSPISSNINARIFSISPLDSLVISAINQLSSKLRTRMRNFLEQERLNHSIGSEARSLIDEILPQMSAGLDTRSGNSKNSYGSEPSNVSRDLSNILKNLKKVEQIFDIFYMLLEPGVSCQELSNEQLSLSNSNNTMVTHASDSDTSGEGQVVVRQTYSLATSTSGSTQRRQFGHRYAQESQSPPSSSSPPHQPRSGFFIEI